MDWDRSGRFNQAIARFSYIILQDLVKKVMPWVVGKAYFIGDPGSNKKGSKGLFLLCFLEFTWNLKVTETLLFREKTTKCAL